MGSFSSKDSSHGLTGNQLDSFHTPPASPQSNEPGFVPGVAQLLPPVSPKSPIDVSSSPTASVLASSIKRSHPSSAIPPPEWRPPPPRLDSNSSASVSAVSPVSIKPENTLAVKGHITLGRNGAPSTSTPLTVGAQGKCVPASPAKSPSATCSSSGAKWRERDNSLSRSLLPGSEARDVTTKELERLLDECRTTLGTSNSKDGPMDVIEMLKHLQAEVKNLKSTMQSERTEWLQFQADLQVAVSVADRLRCEADEELSALRTAHKDVERELAAALQRQKEADKQLVTLRGELEESRQRLATLSQTSDKTNVQEGRKTEPQKTSESREGSQKGKERGVYRLAGSPNDTLKSVVREDCVGVTKRYLRNVTNEERRKDEVQSGEVQRTATTERSRSLSRLPASSDSLTLQNGTSQSTASTTPESTNKNFLQLRGRKSLDQQDSRSNTETGKREESLNKYNSTLSDLAQTRSQDGFNLLLRRHGGSKRNSLLRWCQSQTQGYKNIDITNFSSSWVDGLAFCAVYHSYLPSHIPYSSLSPDNKRENLSLAFKTGETVGIDQTLSVEDMLRAGGPDWQRVLNYVESMYRHFEM